MGIASRFVVVVFDDFIEPPLHETLAYPASLESRLHVLVRRTLHVRKGIRFLVIPLNFLGQVARGRPARVSDSRSTDRTFEAIRRRSGRVQSKTPRYLAPSGSRGGRRRTPAP